MYPSIEEELRKKEVVSELADVKREVLKKHKDRKGTFQIHIFDLEKICNTINVKGKVFSFKYRFPSDRKIGNVAKIDNYCRILLTSSKYRPRVIKNIDKNFDRFDETDPKKPININKENIKYFFCPCLIVQPIYKMSKTLDIMKMYDIFNDFQDHGSFMTFKPDLNGALSISVFIDNMIRQRHLSRSWRVSK